MHRAGTQRQRAPSTQGMTRLGSCLPFVQGFPAGGALARCCWKRSLGSSGAGRGAELSKATQPHLGAGRGSDQPGSTQALPLADLAQGRWAGSWPGRRRARRPLAAEGQGCSAPGADGELGEGPGAERGTRDQELEGIRDTRLGEGSRGTLMPGLAISGFELGDCKWPEGENSTAAGVTARRRRVRIRLHLGLGKPRDSEAKNQAVAGRPLTWRGGRVSSSTRTAASIPNRRFTACIKAQGRVWGRRTGGRAESGPWELAVGFSSPQTSGAVNAQGTGVRGSCCLTLTLCDQSKHSTRKRPQTPAAGDIPSPTRPGTGTQDRFFPSGTWG